MVISKLEFKSMFCPCLPLFVITMLALMTDAYALLAVFCSDSKIYAVNGAVESHSYFPITVEVFVSDSSWYCLLPLS